MVCEHLDEPNYSDCYATITASADVACTTYESTSAMTINTDKIIIEPQFNDKSYIKSNDSGAGSSSSNNNNSNSNSSNNNGENNNYYKPKGNEAHLSPPPAAAKTTAKPVGTGSYKHDQASFMIMDDWSQIAEATLPLKTSEHIPVAYRRGFGSGNYNSFNNYPSSASNLFHASIESRSREISRKLIYVNVISLIINLSLAFVAFYFSFVNNSPSTSAFAADCVLDFISSAIVLWRYYGDLTSVYMHAREQIACIYLGALFEISAIGIIIKATSDIVSGVGLEEGPAGYDLIYLAVAATIACTILTVFKCSLYKTIRDKSILLDVINTLISTIFAMSIIMSQLLISVDLSFWYLDPILSIVLAIFMAGFGLKVIHQNFNILRPSQGNTGTSTLAPWLFGNSNKNTIIGYTVPLINADTSQNITTTTTTNNNNNNFESNLNTSVDYNRSVANWQKTDYSSISFV